MLLTNPITIHSVNITFATTSCGRGELHATFVAAGAGNIAEQCANLASAFDAFLARSERRWVPVFKRVFLSDVTNQASVVVEALGSAPGALSIVGQPPLGPGVKASMLVVMVEDVEVDNIGEGHVVVRRGAYDDLWIAGIATPTTDSRAATTHAFTELDAILASGDMTLRDNCLRTWIYVRDIDNRYAGIVAARNAHFAARGLTRATHFIASTGIEGANGDPRASVTLDAYAVAGLQPGQVGYLQAPTHLNPTADYGVAFERATTVSYGDRRHIIISGTASIDNLGRIVAPGDIESQTRRMLDNIATLLHEGGATLAEVVHSVVYIRDVADRDAALAIIAERLPGVPLIAVNAAVCRPGWLIEMECMAIAPIPDSRYAPY